MKTLLKILAYTAYALVITGVLLYVRFPSKGLHAHLVERINDELPEIIFSAASLKPSFPPGVALEEASFALKDARQAPVFNADHLLVSPGLRALLFGETVLSFDAAAYGGKIKGNIGFEKNNDTADVTLSLKNIRIQDHAFMPRLQLGGIRGILNARVTYRGPRQRITGGEGEGDIQISKGQIALRTPFMGIKTLPFEKFTTELTLKKQILRLTRVNMDGKAFQGSLSGTIILSRDLRQSRLNLRGELEPFENYFKSIQSGPAVLAFFRTGKKGLKRSFVIQGTFAAPRFRFT